MPHSFESEKCVICGIDQKSAEYFSFSCADESDEINGKNSIKPNEYEIIQMWEIVKWKKEEPGVVSNFFGTLTSPITWLVELIVPTQAIQGALKISNNIAKHLSDHEDILKEANISNIEELKTLDMRVSDSLADSVQNWAIGLATVEGAGVGLGGFLSMAIDIPAIITYAIRTIYKIGLCYGYEVKTIEDEKFMMGILAASGANSIEEKLLAIAALRKIEIVIGSKTWKVMNNIAASQQISREATILGIRGLARQLSVNMAKRKSIQSIPGIGAIVGASVNAWYLKEIGKAAKRAFQERWLIDNKKVVEIKF
ncbi:MAG: EcsC family protein [Candidatus Riflebacteria bacterium]|nr:EcsC family protein [Candidatus Riflebacteria bacterium]